MTRRALFLALLLAPTLALAQTPVLSPQDRADIARIEAYLDNLKTLKAHFLQVGPQGDVSEGTAWIDRPGKMRFEYDPPSPFLLVAGYGVGFFHDKNLGQTSNFPLSATPLGILLAEKVRLTGDVTVTGITRLPGQIQVNLIRTGSPGDGGLNLVFADNPLALRQWTVEDAQHKATSVSLYNVTLGGKFDPDLFQFADPKLSKPKDGTGG
jgi:outer membrane lipoprotein-sorting protein